MALEFTEAIEIDPMNADAYLGLAEAYQGMGDIDQAIKTLKTGYEKTADQRLKDKFDELSPSEETTVTTTVSTIVTTTETTTTIELVTVPDMAGMTREEALPVCEELGISCEIKTEGSEGKITETTTSLNYYENFEEIDTNKMEYAIDVKNEREAHIEIISDIINDDFIIPMDPSVSDEIEPYLIFRLSLVIENQTHDLYCGVDWWGMNVKTENFTWKNIRAQVFLDGMDLNYWLEENGIDNSNNDKFSFDYYADTDANKLVMNIKIPENSGIDFKNNENIYLDCQMHSINEI